MPKAWSIMHEPSKSRTGRMQLFAFIAIGLVAAISGVAVWYSKPVDAYTPIWGGPLFDQGCAIWGDGLGNIYTVGTTENFGAGGYDMVLVKWDAAGNQVWYRTLGGASDDIGCGIWGDGASIYTCGLTWNFSKGNQDNMLVKWDSSGNQIWNRTWARPNVSTVWGDGTYIYTLGEQLIKWDTAGNEQWRRDAIGSSIGGDGTYIYTAGSQLAQWDSAGNMTWNRDAGDSSNWRSLLSVWSDGMYIYTAGDEWGDSHDMLLMKWNATGNVLWNRTWGGAFGDVAQGVWGDGTGIYTTGTTLSFGAGRYDMVLVKWDAAGNQVWNHTWGGANDDYGEAIWGDRTSIYTTGSTSSIGSGNLDMVLVKWTEGFGEITHFPDPRVAWIIFIAVIAIVALAACVLTFRFLLRRGRETKDHFLVNNKPSGTMSEVIYQRQSDEQPPAQQPIILSGNHCMNCGQVVPKGFEMTAYCVFCGKLMKGKEKSIS